MLVNLERAGGTRDWMLTDDAVNTRRQASGLGRARPRCRRPTVQTRAPEWARSPRHRRASTYASPICTRVDCQLGRRSGTVARRRELLAQTLAATRSVKLLSTSREALRVAAERVYPVPPLGVPDPARLPELSALSQYDAVALFIERAKAVAPDFEMTEANAPALAEICVRLDALGPEADIAHIDSAGADVSNLR